MKKLFLVVLVISVVVVSASQTFAIPVEISYQGYLTDTGGVPVNGVKNITFKLYTVESEGTEVWSSGPVTVDVANGVYSVILGDTSSGSTQPAINPAIFADQLWLGITVEADPEMAPRQKLTPVSYSINALSAQTAETISWNAVSDKPADFDDSIDNDTLGSLQCSTDQIAKWSGSAWVCADFTPQTGQPPSAPTGVQATAGDGQITISWSPVSGATTYNIYWSMYQGVTTSNYLIIGASSPYTQINLTNNTTYYYIVTAINAEGESSPSAEVSAVPRAPFLQTREKVLAPDAEANDYFGWSVSISGDYAVVGAPYEDGGGTDAGAAYIYHRTGPDTWDGGTKITASDAQADDSFGKSVSISGDYAVVGADYEDGGGTYAGAAYIYHRTGLDTWDSGTKITAPDAEANDYFGHSVSISGDYAIVGAYLETSIGGHDAGAAYIYHRTGLNTWDGGTKITAPDAQENDEFGISVSISGDYAVVGARYEDDEGTDAGAAYIYHRTGPNTWDGGTKITAPDAQADDRFGWSVSISGDYAVVGVPYEDGGGSDAGAAYIYHRTGLDTWNGGTKITAPDAQENDEFGISVSISGDSAVVGVPYEDGGGSDAGAAYIYHRTGTNTWDAGTKITAPDAELGDLFGWSVSINGDSAIVGAIIERDGGSSAGAAYIY